MRLNSRHPWVVMLLASFAFLGLPVSSSPEARAETGLPAGASNCQLRDIGTSQSDYDFPFQTWYNASRTQSIYLASEIGPAGLITELALEVTSIPGQDLNNWTIRMKHTEHGSYDPGAELELDGWTVVYQGDDPQGAAGWRTYPFTTPFAYDGVSNLMVDFSFHNSDWSYPGYCGSFQPGGYRTLVRFADDAGDPLTWSGSADALANYDLPALRLTVCSDVQGPSVPVDFIAIEKSATSITWSWTPGSGDEEGFTGYDASRAVVWTVPGHTTLHTEAGLAPNTEYTRYVCAWNAEGTSGPSDIVSACTLPVPPDVKCDRRANRGRESRGRFTFVNLAGFGPGGVGYYQYVWNCSRTHEFDGSESDVWDSGTLDLVADGPGLWFLHLVSLNDRHEVGGTMRLGPFPAFRGPAR